MYVQYVSIFFLGKPDVIEQVTKYEIHSKREDTEKKEEKMQKMFLPMHS